MGGAGAAVGFLISDQQSVAAAEQVSVSSAATSKVLSVRSQSVPATTGPPRHSVIIGSTY